MANAGLPWWVVLVDDPGDHPTVSHVRIQAPTAEFARAQIDRQQILGWPVRRIVSVAREEWVAP